MDASQHFKTRTVNIKIYAIMIIPVICRKVFEKHVDLKKTSVSFFGTNFLLIERHNSATWTSMKLVEVAIFLHISS